MKITARWLASSLGVSALTVGTAALLSSCSPAQSRPQATIKIDGSSTVYPITNAIAAEFQAPKTVSSVGYIPLPADGYHLAKIQLDKGEVGTVFGGKAELNVTIEELLRKQATY